ncbi:hypothetical protein [Anaerostipes amylophilus]|jgi:hypothetical protein|uniref:hypothetical protein n=1 Tax=Anaerostipes amylophilus TaxID=2981779 RepID=UPI0006BEF737|nr:hypothetical protein [Anaerostipes amylophilus]MCU6781172.1 hypothetical protein [Anaerostipes amylophilus]CUN90766.1 Uncharacterised protein [Anaerostipes hadrus]
MGIKKFVKKIVAILITLFIVLIYAVGEPKMQKYALVLMAIYTVMAVIYWIKQVRFETVIFIISTIVIFGVLTVILPSSKDKNSVIKTDKIILSKKGTLYRENKKTKKKVKLADNIQKYYLGDRIVVQNSTQIISLSYDGKDILEVKKNAILKGYNDETVYYTKLKEEQNSSTKKFTLYKMNLDTMEEEKDMQSDKYIRSVTFKDGEKEIKSIEE